MKALYILLTALFLYMVTIQFNDPDPLYWAVVYGGVAAVTLAQALGKRSEFWITVLIGATVAGMIIAAPGFFEFVAAGDIAAMGDMQNAGYVEPAREFGGLLIALAALVYCYKAKSGSSR